MDLGLKKVFFVLFILFFSLIPVTKNVNGAINISFLNTSDPDGAYTNDGSAIDGNTGTYAYTTLITDDHYLEMSFNYGYDDALFCKKILVNLGWAKIGTFDPAQYVDIQMLVSDKDVVSGFDWVNVVTDGTYNYNTDTYVTLPTIEYVFGIRVRSDDPSNTYRLRVFEVTPIQYVPSATYDASTEYFDWREDDYYSIYICGNWVNITSTAYTNFEVYPLGNYFYFSNNTQTTSNDCCSPCNSTNLTLFYDLMNVTGQVETNYSGVNGWTLWVNYTGNASAGDGCANFSGIYYINYSDLNLTFNATVFFGFHNETCSVNHTSDVTNVQVNESSWFNTLSAVLFDNSQFFLVIMFMLWLFFVSKSYSKDTTFFAIIQFIVCIPLFLYLVSLSYLNNNLVYGYLVSVSVFFSGFIVLITGMFQKR